MGWGRSCCLGIGMMGSVDRREVGLRERKDGEDMFVLFRVV